MQIIPILHRSCGNFSSCHQNSSASASNGIPLDIKDPTALLAALMAPAEELPSMKYVTPGDPTQSFLMRKIDNNLMPLVSMCGGLPEPACGESMPKGGTLTCDDRALFRRWIAQGAQAN
jgi:hypothetical protein